MNKLQTVIDKAYRLIWNKGKGLAIKRMEQDQHVGSTETTADQIYQNKDRNANLGKNWPRDTNAKRENSETSCHGTVDRRQGKTQEQ